MKTCRVYLLVMGIASLAVPASFAQRGGGAQHDIGSADMAKVFGKNQAFSATAVISIVDEKHTTPMSMETGYAFLKGNVRTELDMGKDSKIPPQAIAQMKQMGMDRVVNIYRGDKKIVYLLYPGLKSYTEIVPPSASDDKGQAKESKIDVTQVGKDTVDGHPCVQNKITITADDGSQHEMLAWQATDMKDFPIKTEIKEGGATITTHFTNIKLSAPDAALFDPPSDFTKYGSAQEMMMSHMQQVKPPVGGNQ